MVAIVIQRMELPVSVIKVKIAIRMDICAHMTQI